MKTGRSVVQAKVPSVGLFCVSFDSVASAVCDVCQKEGRETTSTQSDVTRLQIVRLDLAFVRFLLLVVLEHFLQRWRLGLVCSRQQACKTTSFSLSLPRKDSITVGQLAGFQMPSSRRSQARWRTIAMMRFAYTRHVFALGRRDADSSTTNNTWSKPISHEYCCLAI